MDAAVSATAASLDPAKFRNPRVTVAGEARAVVSLKRLRTLWFNTGTRCNLACINCYIESSPVNDRLAFITTEEVRSYLDEIAAEERDTEEIGFTGGEPFINPDMTGILDLTLSRGFRALVLTNAMKPMWKAREKLLRLRDEHGDRLAMRVSVDHYDRTLHEEERGPNAWEPTIRGLQWLAANRFNLNVAGRTMWSEEENELRAGYARLFADLGLGLDAYDPVALVLFPEMDQASDVPEITAGCWSLLGVSPDAMMCAESRMVIKRKGNDRPVVVPCTLLPYDSRFEMGETLAEAEAEVPLNHPHCARFCVLGGGSCSKG